MDILLLISFAFLGALTASFVGVLSVRLNTGQAWAKSRSRCDACARPLAPGDLIPIFSWLLALGKCRTCGSKIPVSSLVTEVALAVIFSLAVWQIGFTFPLIPFLIAVSVLCFIVLYDVRHTLVPPFASFLLFLGSVCFAVLSIPDLKVLGSALLISGVIALLFFSLHVFSKGRAMGLGDAPVALSLSLLAFPYSFGGLLFSFWIGALFGIGVLLARRGGPTMGIEVPFVPFLSLGFLLAYFLEWTPL